MKQRVEEMEREANKLRELQAAAEKQEGADGSDASATMEGDEERTAADGRSVFVGNVYLFFHFAETALTLFLQVDYSSTPEEIQQHFQACGVINRVTILCDKFTGHPKGYEQILAFRSIQTNRTSSFAYVEFADPESIDTALAMDNSLFRGRLIKVGFYGRLTCTFLIFS